MTQILSREEARAQGLKAFYTGTPCKRGHVEHLSVANGMCRACNRENSKRCRDKDPEADRARSRAWYAANKTRAREWKKNWIANNPEQYRKRRTKWRSTASSRSREMIAAAKWSAKSKGLPFDLDREWLLPLIEAGKCQLTGLRFNLAPLADGGQNPYTGSLDRITPELGYIKSNVRVILWALNAAFNTYGEGVYAEIARVYLVKQRNSEGIT